MSDPRPIATPTLRPVVALRILERTCEPNQRPAIVISGSVRKTAAHLIGPGVSRASRFARAGAIRWRRRAIPAQETIA